MNQQFICTTESETETAGRAIAQTLVELRHQHSRRLVVDGPEADDERRRACGEEPASQADQIVARPQVEVIRVRQNDVGMQRLDLIKCQTFDRRARAHRHKCRRLHGAVRQLEDAASRATLGRGHGKRQISSHVGGPCGKPAYNDRA